MDALTSMSTVTGYKAVIMAAYRFPRIIPMIGTAIGTLKPARFLIIGAGVVGLQAIATAKRLGATIKAVDISAAARSGAESLGAKIAGFDVPPEIALEEGTGYARALPAEWLREGARGPGPAGRRGRHHHHERPGARRGRPDPDHRGDGGRHEARVGHHRRLHRPGRQLRPHRAGRRLRSATACSSAAA